MTRKAPKQLAHGCASAAVHVGSDVFSPFGSLSDSQATLAMVGGVVALVVLAAWILA